jgi:hypothetical protein
MWSSPRDSDLLILNSLNGTSTVAKCKQIPKTSRTPNEGFGASRELFELGIQVLPDPISVEKRLGERGSCRAADASVRQEPHRLTLPNNEWIGKKSLERCLKD